MKPVSAPTWLVEGLIPAGAVVGIAGVDDGTPEEILARGYDVVLHLSERDVERPALVTVLWRDGLAPGHLPPTPFWVRFDPAQGGYVRCEDGSAA